MTSTRLRKYAHAGFDQLQLGADTQRRNDFDDSELMIFDSAGPLSDG